MKIARAIIENFRKVEKLELDFRDELGRVRDFTLIVGPNTSGKTTILDALAVSIGPGTELSYGPTGITLNPPTIVRRGALNGRNGWIISMQNAAGLNWIQPNSQD